MPSRVPCDGLEHYKGDGTSLSAALDLRQGEQLVCHAACSIEDIWKSPQLTGVALSRSGKYLAATAPHKGRMNVVVIDMETRQRSQLTSFEEFDVLGPTWVGDERLVFSLGQANSPTGPGQFDGGGLFVVARDGYGKAENNVDLYTQVLKFLDDQIGK